MIGIDDFELGRNRKRELFGGGVLPITMQAVKVLIDCEGAEGELGMMGLVGQQMPQGVLCPISASVFNRSSDVDECARVDKRFKHGA